MMRKIICLIICFLLIPASMVLALNAASLPRVVDNAGLLTEQQAHELQGAIDSLIDEYHMDIVILSLDSLNGKTSQSYADDYYDENGYGYGSDCSGLLLLVSKLDRELCISTTGQAIDLFTDHSIDNILTEISEYLSVNNYYAAFHCFLDILPAYLGNSDDRYYNDAATDMDTSSEHWGSNSRENQPNIATNLLISIVIGLGGGLVAIILMRAQMNTKRPQHHAGDYLKEGSFSIHERSDLFLYSNVSKVPRPKDNEGSSGGRIRGSGGTSVHRSSSGRTHGGGSRKF